MPTVIDSLVVKLGLDPSGFKTGVRQAKDSHSELTRALTAEQQQMARHLGLTEDEFRAWSAQAQKSAEVVRGAAEKTGIDIVKVGKTARRTGSELRESGKEGATFFSALNEQALGLIGTLVGATGLAAIIRGTTESMANLGREAANLNVDPQQLGAFSMALERFGASGQSTRNTLFGINQALETWKLTGQGNILQYLNLIGGGPNQSPFRILHEFMAFAQAHKNDASLVNLVGHGLGIDQGTINASLQIKSQAEFQRQYNQALRDAPTAEEVRHAQALQEKWVGLEQAAIGLANKVTTQLSPALQDVADWGAKEIHQNPMLVEAITAIFTGLSAIAGIRIVASTMGLTGLAGVLGGVATTVERIVPVLALLGLTGPAGDIHGKTQAKAISGANATEEAWMRTHGSAPPQFADHWWLQHAPTALGGIPAAQTGSSVAAISHYFLSKGYTPQQVAGILANIQAESGFNPYATNGTHFGLFQWDKARQAQFAMLFGHPIQRSTPYEQLQFAQWELTHTEKKAGNELRHAKTRYQSGAVISLDYERPGGGAQTADYRGMLARQYSVHPLATPGAPAMVHNETHIHHVELHAKNADANAVARYFSRELVTMANTGLQ